jgi:(p)ppGpp synthase/HD superfamily hydrolase
MKKTDELLLDKTMAFAQQCYANHTTFVNGALYDHCFSVARYAEKIAHKLYQDLRVEYAPENIDDALAVIVHCGLLHDVLNVSACAFENIAEITNVQVAAMVAAISRDFRLVETKRDMEFRGRLSQSAVGTQIVAVADIICTAKLVAEAVDANGLAVAVKAKKILAQLDGDLMAVQAANKYYVLRMYVHAARNLLVEISKKIKAFKQRARAEKLVLQNTKTLRESVAASKRKAAAKKGKDAHYAKKRNSRKDS